MNFNLVFYLTNILLGIGLAMDAFSVSMANGLSEPNMSKKKHIGISSIFGLFQGVMPFIGWVLVHTLLFYFNKLRFFIPFIALILLSYIGIKMIIDGMKKTDEKVSSSITIKLLLVQAIATSIDALSVGLDIGEYNIVGAIIASLIIALITFIICFIGVIIGKKFGMLLSNKAQIFGGVILIIIGLEIFITGLIELF